MSESLPRPHPSDATLHLRWVDQWIAGTCAPDDALAIVAWLDAQPGRRTDMDRMRENAMGVFAYPNVTAPEVVWERLRPGAAEEMALGEVGLAAERTERGVIQEPWTLEQRVLGREKRDSGTRTLRQAFWPASVIAVVLLAFGLISYQMPRDPDITRTYVTQSGQQATFTLTDSTRVTLAPRTTLRLRGFGPRSRQVDLDGQAYFEVTRSANVPFLVRTGAVATQVLGTAFLVRHYANDGAVHIAVTEGKVGVVSNKDAGSVASPRGMEGHFTQSHGVRRIVSRPLLLTAGHVGDITDSTVQVNTVNDLTQETDWLRGSLVFRHVPVSEVLQALSRWYGYQFRCSDSAIVGWNVTLALNARSSAKALETLEEVLSVHLTVTGDTVTLSPHARTSGANARKRVYDLWIPTREAGR